MEVRDSALDAPTRRASSAVPASADNAIAETRAGLPTARARALASYLGLEHQELAWLLGISPRTLDRRLADAERLGPLESDRLARAYRVVGRAQDVFDADDERACAWLAHPNRALDGASPRSLLDTDAGVQAVLRVLDRIDFGLYS